MKQSYLEIYIEILSRLTKNSSKPMNLDSISKKLKDRMTFLVDQGLVKERGIGQGNTIYVITQRGISVVNYFRKFSVPIPLIDNKDPFRESI